MGFVLEICDVKNTHKLTQRNLQRNSHKLCVCVCVCVPPHWQSSTRGISQIWLHVREESRKIKKILPIYWRPAETYCLNMVINFYIF